MFVQNDECFLLIETKSNRDATWRTKSAPSVFIAACYLLYFTAIHFCCCGSILGTRNTNSLSAHEQQDECKVQSSAGFSSLLVSVLCVLGGNGWTALVVPSPDPAGLQSASRVPRPLLGLSAVPVDATQDLAPTADMPPAFMHRVHGEGWAVQDHPEGPAHRRLVSHGH